MNENIFINNPKITSSDKFINKTQTPLCIWFTGLSGSGKSTLANELEFFFNQLDKISFVIDGDNLRSGLTANLSFDEHDRLENNRIAAEVSKLFLDAGLITIVSLISPKERYRVIAREICKDYNFILVYLNTPISVCEERDVKGLYKKARNGNIKDFTGISSDFEIPENPDLIVDTSHSVQDSLKLITNYLKEKNYF